ncbi:sensor histidine kinase [Litoreibacter arenae]|uniref:histidine kinase n=1 Tax=Litoreibacter arenae DSM 19593 TaxID=1123360 RepID=S9RZQ7_9RHOB|nr:sensor histidine kinase [Litoreibacter arenae]EPX79464.1 hypothetical protein thalar_02289 [Litoreibacter arenae DSM 19593]
MSSLRFRVVAMLSLALLPIGLIAVIQTKQVADSSRRNAELLLLTRTERAASDIRYTIEQARGAARFLGASNIHQDTIEECEQSLRNFVNSDPRFSFVGVLPRSGDMKCSSSGAEFDFKNTPSFQQAMSEGKSVVGINQSAPFSGKSVIIVSEPYFDGREVEGLISVSIPHERLSVNASDEAADGLVNVITFNTKGDILTSIGPLDVASLDLPQNTKLPELLGQGAYSFSAVDAQNYERIYAVIPIVDQTVYTLGVWDANAATARPLLSRMPAWIFPVIMWVVSLGVALSTVNRLVVRHVRRLGREMSAFARNRTVPSEHRATMMPAEIEQIEDDFRDMSAVILRDEAELENSLRDKNVLLKEIHHRVKNNLQLISSIISMQIRKARNAETRYVLGRVQDRVLSLATIHRDLYQTSDAGRINVGALITEIVEKSLEIAKLDDSKIELDVDIQDVFLYPDQAVPLSLMASEAVTNALKHVGAGLNGREWIRISLTCAECRDCKMIMENSIGAPMPDVESTGLGAQLIRTFAMQLGGQIDVEETDNSYKLTVEFQVVEFTSDAVDY